LKVIAEKCVGCALCVPYCPVNAIHVTAERKAVVDEDKCFECWVCHRVDVCPTEAIQPVELKWPRDLMWNFACPTKDWPMTRMAGRGTEEMKTNEVTGRFKRGEVGIGVDVGRPGVGTTFDDVEKITRAVAPLGVMFEKENPISMIIDVNTGKLADEKLRNVKVLSAVLEFKTTLDNLKNVLRELQKVSRKINTVMSVALISRVEPDGSVPFLKKLGELGIEHRPNTKTNVGLGRTPASM